MLGIRTRLYLFRFFSIVYIGYGLNYIFWRHQESLNEDALLFSYTLFIAELLMFIGSVLMIINHWNIKKIKIKKPPFLLSQIKTINDQPDRPLVIDIFIATYNEPLVIVEETVRNAVRLSEFSKKIIINYYLCDDGNRDGSIATGENFRQLASKYNIHYFTRSTNKGYKAGNLNNAFWQTQGDFIVILDADTIVYPKFINNLLPYFKDEKMAWVQSPQYFYDISKGKPILEYFHIKLGVRKVIEFIFPFVKGLNAGKDIFGTDPKIFYEVILYHRNASNSAFCCGAGSIHRRDALESLMMNNNRDLMALDSYVDIEKSKICNISLFERSGYKCLGPFVHHISEDIYTSILMHSNPNHWKSYQHPTPECKMLSPQTLTGFDQQFSRYAEGTFSIFFSRNNPVIKKGLSIWQRIAYAETLYSYFSAFWIVIFLLSPIIFYFTLVPPLKAFSFDFFLRFIVLNILSQIITLFGYWGIATGRSDQYYISGFWLKIRALFKVIFKNKLEFNTTKKEKDSGNFNRNIKLITPHLLIVFFTIAGLTYNIYLIKIDQHPSLSAFWANNIWATYNIYQLSPIIRSAFLKN